MTCDPCPAPFQLIAECKEALKAAVLVRGVFVRRMRAIRPPAGAELCIAKLDQAVETFDADVKEMLEVLRGRGHFVAVHFLLY